MTPKIKPITSYQHLQLFINEPDLSDTISSSMHRDEYSASVMLWGLNKSTLQKEVKRCANKMFQILSATKNNDEHAILIPIELLSHPKFIKKSMVCLRSSLSFIFSKGFGFEIVKFFIRFP